MDLGPAGSCARHHVLHELGDELVLAGLEQLLRRGAPQLRMRRRQPQLQALLVGANEPRQALAYYLQG